jgi:hypothetical protein
MGEKNPPILLYDFCFLYADIFQSTVLCEFILEVWNAVKKSYQLQFSALENLYQKGYVQVRTLSSPSLNVALLNWTNSDTDIYQRWNQVPTSSRHPLSTSHTHRKPYYKSGKWNNPKSKSAYQERSNNWYVTQQTAFGPIEGCTGKLHIYRLSQKLLLKAGGLQRIMWDF